MNPAVGGRPVNETIKRVIAAPTIGISQLDPCNHQMILHCFALTMITTKNAPKFIKNTLQDIS